jgi:hypothetical protein
MLQLQSKAERAAYQSFLQGLADITYDIALEINPSTVTTSAPPTATTAAAGGGGGGGGDFDVALALATASAPPKGKSSSSGDGSNSSSGSSFASQAANIVYGMAALGVNHEQLLQQLVLLLQPLLQQAAAAAAAAGGGDSSTAAAGQGGISQQDKQQQQKQQLLKGQGAAAAVATASLNAGGRTTGVTRRSPGSPGVSLVPMPGDSGAPTAQGGQMQQMSEQQQLGAADCASLMWGLGTLSYNPGPQWVDDMAGASFGLLPRYERVCTK